jgi:hypothetical protein
MARPVQSTYTVYSIKGTVIKYGRADDHFDIDLSAFDEGMYVLKIKTDQTILIKKIILI